METLFFAQLLFIGIGNGFLFQNYTYEHTRRGWPLYLKSYPLVKNVVTSSSMEHIVVIASKQYDVPLGEIATDYPVTLLFETVDSFHETTRSIMQNILAERTVNSYWKRLNFIVITKKDEIEYILEKAQELDVEVGKKCVLRHFSRWILIPTDDIVSTSSLRNTLFDHINVISEDTSLNNTSTASETEITLQTLMWESKERILREHVEFFKTGKSPFPNVNYGLNGRRISAAALEWLPFSKKETSIKGNLLYTGISGEIMNRLSIIFNFSIQYVEPADQQWGEEINSSWTGIVGMMQQEEADMCAVPYAVNIERERVMTYSYPFLYKHQSAVYRRSVAIGHSWTVLISCFKWEVYICGFVTLFLVFVMFNLFEILNRFWFGTTCRPGLTSTEVAMLTFSVPLHQGSHSIPSASSSKILLSFWWIFCIVLTGVYTGNLIAILTVSRESIPFRTMEELAEQNTYEVGTTSGDFIELLIKTSNSSVFQGLWEKAKLSKVSSSLTTEQEWQVHMNRINTGQYVFLVDETKLELMMRENCDIAKIPDHFMPIYSSFTFPKDSPLAFLFADELMYMTEHGLISTWFKMWSPKAKICVEKNQHENIQMSAGDLISGFLAFTVGICLATICLVTEVIIHALYHEKKEEP